jgi:peptidoglycan hydrolase CwlO-like protein
MPFDEGSYDSGGGDGSSVTVQGISDAELGLIGSNTGVTPISTDIATTVESPITQEFTAQTPAIQAVESSLPNFQDILPQDLSTQIQNMSQALLQQQTQIQSQVQTTIQQQKTVNDAATAYQKIYASASPQITAATSDYNSSLAGYNQAYAQYAKSHNPNYLGSVLGQLQRDIPNVSAGWFLNKMNTDKATITNLNNQITAASTAYANDLATYKATSANLQSSVSTYNSTYANYQGAVATAQGDVTAAQQAAQAKAQADAKAASDAAAAKTATDAAAKSNATVTTGGTGNATTGGTTGNATISSTTGNATATAGGNATVATGGGAGGNVTIAGTGGNGTGAGGGAGGILPGGGNGTITSTGSNVAVTAPTTNTSPTITTVPEANVTVTATGPDNAASNTANATTGTASTLPPSKTPTGSRVTMPSSIASTTPLGSALLGSALSSQPEPAVAGGDPYILGTDEARKNVWNQESLRNALGI